MKTAPKDHIYFCLSLTESEHEVIKDGLEDLCDDHGMTLVFYRPLNPHQSMLREVKVEFNGKREFFHQFMEMEGLWKFAKRWDGHKLTDWCNAENRF